MHPQAATYPVASDHASLPRWALALPCVLWPQTLPPCRGGLRCCHTSRGPEPHLLAEVSSGASTCPMALGSASLRGELRCCHMSHGPQRVMDHRNKERPSYPRHVARLARYREAHMHYRGVYKTCRQVSSSLPGRHVDRPLQCGSVVQCHAAAHSQARLAGDVT
jgi:hypothetical protein